jgi:RNA polymerase sigma-70 factor (ECF subfamily)
VLDPDVVLRTDVGGVPPGAPREICGAREVAGQALAFSGRAPLAQPALVNGAAGVVSRDSDGRPFSVMGFTIRGGRIVEIDIFADPARLSRLDLSVLDN